MNGKLLAGVVDDAVSVENGEGSRSAFREVEVEIGDETTPGLLDALVERLRQAGAGPPDKTAKYIRALGADVPLTPEIVVNDLGADASAGGAVQRALALSAIRLIRHDAVMRLDTDPEGVHQARVATRRLRSDLRTFRSLLDDEFASSLRSELGWLAGILGDVRDGDVLLERLRRRAAELPEADRDAAAPVLTTRSRPTGTRHMRRSSRRWRAGATSACSTGSSPPRTIPRSATTRACRRRTSSPASYGGRGTSSPSVSRSSTRARPTRSSTQIRIRTKRARYAAEAAAPIVGKPARAFAHAAADLQDVLGDLNDAVVAARWLDEWATQHGAENTRGAEALSALERAAAAELRGRWRPVWEELAAPELRAWM